MKSASKSTVKKLVNQGVVLEYKNADTLRKNLASARNQLVTVADKEGFGSQEYRFALDQSLGLFESKAKQNFDITGAIKMGLSDGKILAAEMITGGRSDRKNMVANFMGWKPLLPLAAISAKESEFADLITGLTQDARILHLRAIQQGLALGITTDGLIEQILGQGIKGRMGRDGIWRKATHRAEAIARTVSNDLINYGAQLTYAQMDLTTPEAGFEKVWQTVSDNRTSDRCLSLSATRAKIEEPFTASDGWSGQRPPAHPNCRSRITLVARRYQANWDLRYR
jgi:hypothetical protein